MSDVRIEVVSAVGCGPNELAAFDDALLVAGVANFNLVRLSSVIPPASTPVVVPTASPSGQWGDRLYVVYAAQWCTGAGSSAAAGVGWVQDPRSGAGLFVEHEDPSDVRVGELISESLAVMCSSRGLDWPGPSMEVVSTSGVDGESRCAFVVAVYGSRSWDDVDFSSQEGSPR